MEIRMHDHCVNSGPLELVEFGAGRLLQLGDHELPGRDIREEIEHALEGAIKQEKLGIEPLEHILELLLAASPKR
jgi:hypothetical protein